MSGANSPMAFIYYQKRLNSSKVETMVIKFGMSLRKDILLEKIKIKIKMKTFIQNRYWR